MYFFKILKKIIYLSVINCKQDIREHDPKTFF